MLNLRNYVVNTIKYLAYQINEHESNLQLALEKQATLETLEYIKSRKIQNLLNCNSWQQQISHALKQVKIDGLYCEFGVHSGVSANYTAKQIKDKTLYGFDSFNGLPNDWYFYEKDYFKIDPPKLEPNVKLIEGWFKDTLPKFVSKDKIAFMNIDSDVYISAKDVFDNLGQMIIKDTIIRFDEYWNFPFWQFNEFKAFKEFIEKSKIEYEYLSTTNMQGVVVRIK